MSIDAVRQLDAIHTMLSTGHRNLRMERHSLMLWGIAGGLLFALSEHILTPEQFPEVQQRAIAWLLLLTVVLSVVGIADWHLTRKIKAERDEVWSFIHRQIMKVWWLIFALGALLTFAMFFTAAALWRPLPGSCCWVWVCLSMACFPRYYWSGRVVRFFNRDRHTVFSI